MSNATSKNPKTYIAITIGPILRTINLTSSPAALWASSYLFSYIAKSLRDELIKKQVTDEAFISPYIAPNNHALQNNKGYGLLHDHIIFEKPEKFTLNDIKEIRNKVLQDVDKKFAIYNLDFLKKYVMISAVEYEAENPIIGSGKMLDCAELATAFVPEEPFNPILAFFNSKNREDARNQDIKKQGIEELHILSDNWQLLKKHKDASKDEQNKDKYWNYQVKDLETIALGENENAKMKKHSYYALVRSDGDNMGKLISRLSSSNQFHTFSDACLRYCEKVSDLVGSYHGMTVYAGGDDLLAILPCENLVKANKTKGADVKSAVTDSCETLVEDNKRKTVFDFVREANEIFAEMFLTNSEGGSSNKTVKDILDEINKQPEEKKTTAKSTSDFLQDVNRVFEEKYSAKDEHRDSVKKIKRILDEINEKIKKDDSNEKKLPPPSLTWGITLCHSKYPLYEALEDSASLLFGAKGKDYKNAVNLRLIKHSGQTSAVYIKNDLLKEEKGTFFSLLNDILGRTKKEENTSGEAGTEEAQKKAKEKEEIKEAQNNDILLSCLHTFHEARAVFRLADEDNTENLFKNMFDADAHKDNRFLHDSLPTLYANHCLSGDICALDDKGDKVMLGKKGNQKPDAPEALHYLLRILKFFVEKAGEKE